MKEIKEAIHTWTEKVDLILETSYGVIDSERGVEVEFSIRLGGDYGSFEIYDIKTGGQNWYAEGGLWFEGNTLVEYDGVFELCSEIINKLNELGIDTSEIE